MREYPQPEMWKLAFVKADLKVLITYWNKNPEYAARRFSERLQELTVAGVPVENEEYLVIVDPRALENPSKPIPWRYFRLGDYGKYQEINPGLS